MVLLGASFLLENKTLEIMTLLRLAKLFLKKSLLTGAQRLDSLTISRSKDPNVIIPRSEFKIILIKQNSLPGDEFRESKPAFVYFHSNSKNYGLVEMFLQ